MATFPTLSLGTSINFSKERIKPIVKTKFEGNYAQTRPKYTRTMSKFKISYNALTTTDVSTMETFFDANSGGEFTWTDPSTTTDYTVRFSEETIGFKHIGNDLYSLDLVLEEV